MITTVDFLGCIVFIEICFIIYLAVRLKEKLVQSETADSKTLMTKERINVLERQIKCRHRNSVFIEEIDSGGVPTGRPIKRCFDCDLDIVYSKEEALPLIKKYHEQRLEKAKEMIGEHNG